MEFIDGDGNIIMPRAVRPITDLKELLLAAKRGPTSRYRYGNLYIRDYETHYSVHMDTVDPLSNPLGHLLVDAPESLAGATARINSRQALRHNGLQYMQKGGGQ